jgi:acetyltransferase
MAARLTQIDYDREMAFVLTDDAPVGAADIHGVARLHADPDNVAAEYAIIVQSEEKGRGLGTVLMTELIAHAKRRGLRQLFGFVLRANDAMLALCRDLGFRARADAESDDVIRVELDL